LLQNGKTPYAVVRCRLLSAQPAAAARAAPALAPCRPPALGRRRAPPAAASAAAAAAFVDVSFVAASAYAVCLFAVMLLPPAAWRRRAVASLWTYAPLAALYLALLALSWEADTLSLMLPGSWEEGLRSGRPQFFPQLACVMELLQRRVTAASAWAHRAPPRRRCAPPPHARPAAVLAVNAFLGRHVYLDGWRAGLATQHSLLLCLFAGPAGLACHLATKALVLGLRQARRRSSA